MVNDNEMKEKYYDEHIAPKLREIGRECQEKGMPFLAVCEWAPGDFGRTAYVPKEAGEAIKQANRIAKFGNTVALAFTITSEKP